MAEYTQFAGLYKLDPGDPVSLNNYEFYENETVVDQYIQAFVTHRHNAAPAMPDFASAPTVVPSASGGQLDPSVTYYVGVTALDVYGGETAAYVASATTVGTVSNPTIPPTGIAASAGTLNLGVYRYAYTLLDAYGESLISPQVNVSVGNSGRVTVGLPSTAITKRLYRSFGYGEFNKVADVASATLTYVDTGSVAVSSDQVPPDENTAGATNKLIITRPSLPASAALWRVYVSEESDLASPSSLYAYSSANVRDIPSAATSVDFTTDSQIRPGAPPVVSRTVPGASLLYATDVQYDGAPNVPSGSVESALDYLSTISGSAITSLGLDGQATASGLTYRAALGSAGGVFLTQTPSAGGSGVIKIRATRLGVSPSANAPVAPSYTGLVDFTISALPGMFVMASGTASGAASASVTNIVIDNRRRHRTVWSASAFFTGSANYIGVLTDDMIVASATAQSSGNVKIFMPPVASANIYPGIEYTVKSLTSPTSGSAVILDPNGGNLEGVASGRALFQNESLTFAWDPNNSSWWIN